MQSYDKIIIGAGFYGLYAALKCGQQGQRILVLEADNTSTASSVTSSKSDVSSAPFSRATYINQARVHMGYHYPRSFSTAIKSAHYFKRFCNDFSFCCLTEFDQVYATSSHFSWTNAQEFRDFCKAADIRCDDISPDKYFNKGLCDGAFITTEYMAVCDKYEVRPVDVAIQWCIRKKIYPVLGASKPEQLSDTLERLAVELPEAMWGELEAI